MTDDARNGSRPSIHVIDDTKDFGVEDGDVVDAPMAGRMAAKALRQQALAEKEIDGLLEDVRRVERGETAWQKAMTRQMQLVVDELNQVKLARIVWPGVLALSVMFLGGAFAALVWLIATHH
jgi:hypothetical protein